MTNKKLIELLKQCPEDCIVSTFSDDIGERELSEENVVCVPDMKTIDILSTNYWRWIMAKRCKGKYHGKNSFILGRN